MTSLIAYFSFNAFWFALPPVAAFSFVYAATRHEEMSLILRHAARVLFWTFVFLAAIFLLLWWAAL